MNQVVITTESCSDLSREMQEMHHIYSVPMHIDFPDKSFLDGEIPVEEIYQFYQRTKKIPKTSAVNPMEFSSFFRKVAEENPGAAIIHIGYSSQASCTFQNAIIGREECSEIDIHLIDSKNVSGGAANITLKAAQIVQENPQVSVYRLVEMITTYVDKVYTCFVPEHIEYLAAGGRVSNSAALGASILQIKPRIDIINGKLVAAKKYRGSMMKIMPKLVDDFVSGHDLSKQLIYVMYAQGAKKEVLSALQKLLLENGFKEIIFMTIGCVMSIHGGEGAIGLSAVGAEE